VQSISACPSTFVKSTEVESAGTRPCCRRLSDWACESIVSPARWSWTKWSKSTRWEKCLSGVGGSKSPGIPRSRSHVCAAQRSILMSREVSGGGLAHMGYTSSTSGSPPEASLLHRAPRHVKRRASRAVTRLGDHVDSRSGDGEQPVRCLTLNQDGHVVTHWLVRPACTSWTDPAPRTAATRLDHEAIRLLRPAPNITSWATPHASLPTAKGRTSRPAWSAKPCQPSAARRRQEPATTTELVVSAS
jgi:hypothetical protein